MNGQWGSVKRRSGRSGHHGGVAEFIQNLAQGRVGRGRLAGLLDLAALHGKDVLRQQALDKGQAGGVIKDAAGAERGQYFHVQLGVILEPAPGVKVVVNKVVGKSHVGQDGSPHTRLELEPEPVAPDQVVLLLGERVQAKGLQALVAEIFDQQPVLTATQVQDRLGQVIGPDSEDVQLEQGLVLVADRLVRAALLGRADDFF